MIQVFAPLDQGQLDPYTHNVQLCAPMPLTGPCSARPLTFGIFKLPESPLPVEADLPVSPRGDVDLDVLTHVADCWPACRKEWVQHGGSAQQLPVSFHGSDVSAQQKAEDGESKTTALDPHPPCMEVYGDMQNFMPRWAPPARPPVESQNFEWNSPEEDTPTPLMQAAEAEAREQLLGNLNTWKRRSEKGRMPPVPRPPALPTRNGGSRVPAVPNVTSPLIRAVTAQKIARLPNLNKARVILPPQPTPVAGRPNLQQLQMQMQLLREEVTNLKRAAVNRTAVRATEAMEGMRANTHDMQAKIASLDDLMQKIAHNTGVTATRIKQGEAQELSAVLKNQGWSQVEMRNLPAWFRLQLQAGAKRTAVAGITAPIKLTGELYMTGARIVCKPLFGALSVAVFLIVTSAGIQIAYSLVPPTWWTAGYDVLAYFAAPTVQTCTFAINSLLGQAAEVAAGLDLAGLKCQGIRGTLGDFAAWSAGC